MIEKYGAIENAAIDNMFQCMDFLTAYKTFCEGPIENALPSSLDVSLGYEQNWRRELFIVFEIVQRIPIVYRLKDLQGEEIKGTYYEAEVQKVVDSGFYPVENVIKQRKRR
ncbi:uncharacterized transposon-derived protein F54H12.3 [Trichonephila clavipes]|nr:uncharacterized transposon-derived protein F54H12.3 [Trichonephila clavipes]